MVKSSFKNIRKNYGAGFLMIEVLVGIAISAILLTAFSLLIVASSKTARSNIRQIQGELYAREGIEIAKDLEVSLWSELKDAVCASPLICHPEISSGAWRFFTNEELLDGIYTRGVTIEPVYRNQLTFPNEIVETPGVLDPNTKKVVVTVSWQNNSETLTKRLETYVFNSP